MHEIEISEIPPLNSSEQSLLEMHSLLNMLNVLRGELVLIGLALAADDALLQRGLAFCNGLVASLQRPDAALLAAQRIDEHTKEVFAEIDHAVNSRSGAREDPEIAESVSNLSLVFGVLRVRARELLARAQHPEQWIDFSIAQLREDFLQVFAAIAQNSHGKFRIICNAALQRPHDYYLDLKIEGICGDRLRMPPVFQDVIRDLAANARKYTPPGGHITVALHADRTALRLVVKDTGRGIPPDEIATVVHFGRRARNVADVRTLGGGFGLTKAFFVTKQFGGRFWIASELNRGTCIRLEIPVPTVDAHS